MFSFFISTTSKIVFQTGRALVAIIAHYVYSVHYNRNLPHFSPIHMDNFALASLRIQGEFGGTNVRDFFFSFIS